MWPGSCCTSNNYRAEPLSQTAAHSDRHPQQGPPPPQLVLEVHIGMTLARNRDMPLSRWTQLEHKTPTHFTDPRCQRASVAMQFNFSGKSEH